MKLALLLCFLILSSGSLLAQHRVLVYSKATDPRGEHVSNVLQLIVDGQVELSHDLPSLQQYDAVFYFGRFAEAISEPEQKDLAAFVSGGGKLYVRGMNRTTFAGGESDPLWNAVRDSGILFSSMAIATQGSYGVAGTFAEGFEIPNPTYEMLTQDVGGLGHSIGLLPVLIQGGDQGSTQSAWISPDPTIKFVLTMPQGFTKDQAKGLYMEDPFLALVACSYFQLCALDVADRPSTALTISFDPMRSEQHFPSSGSIVLYDLLGRKVQSSEVAERCPLPANLAKGSYIVRWRSGYDHASTTISVF